MENAKKESMPKAEKKPVEYWKVQQASGKESKIFIAIIIVAIVAVVALIVLVYRPPVPYSHFAINNIYVGNGPGPNGTRVLINEVLLTNDGTNDSGIMKIEARAINPSTGMVMFKNTSAEGIITQGRSVTVYVNITATPGQYRVEYTIYEGEKIMNTGAKTVTLTNTSASGNAYVPSYDQRSESTSAKKGFVPGFELPALAISAAAALLLFGRRKKNA
ncbi:MAG: hypothetical protein WC974_00040 [Thermoplasmata archaeon]